MLHRPSPPTNLGKMGSSLLAPLFYTIAAHVLKISLTTEKNEKREWGYSSTVHGTCRTVSIVQSSEQLDKKNSFKLQGHYSNLLLDLSHVHGSSADFDNTHSLTSLTLSPTVPCAPPCPTVPCAPPCPTALGLIGPRKKE